MIDEDSSPDLWFTSNTKGSKMTNGNHLEPVVDRTGFKAYNWEQLETRPIEQFFGLLASADKGKISVQSLSQKLSTEKSYIVRDFVTVRKRFLAQKIESDNPYNLLDFCDPTQCGLPPFLQNQNCLMLNQIAQRVLGHSSAQRASTSAEASAQWRQLEHWSLLAQGGNMTAPHTDGCGIATWIAPQEGKFGFGWMSKPSLKEWEAWANKTHDYSKGEWRYIVLEPGQVIFFPSGTIHYVFRSRESQTLAIGGHMLQWSNTRRWLEIIELQLRYPNSTNEDTTQMLVQMLQAAEELIQEKIARKDEGPLKVLGGAREAAATEMMVKVGQVQGREMMRPS